jgi:mannitol/fructose-specific phosphotransferase system IIA component (Ntr-type)
MIEVGTFLHPGLVVDLDESGRDACVDRLLAAVAGADVVPDPQLFAEKIKAREAESSTAIGMGVAIPHVRMGDIPEFFIAFGRHRKGVDYDAMDGAPVQFIFLIGATTDQQKYLKLIMRISWLIRNDELRRELLEAPDAASLYELLKQY